MEIINEVDLGNYDLLFSDLTEIRKISRDDGSDCAGIIAAYKYGFARGQRASAAKARRARKEARA
ncbi:hypothetical protein [Ruthenibacterium lactatiformans]|uniref:hypothetical protein n=1 Tax=Ruthenibacterium lactatiformans TaxID=1550024 RepID=UPI0026739094|nr:hypothetical protein [Ruthenibacterium lactatiformans]